MYYEYSRWYDPSIGRFISQDSYPGYLSDPQSLNPYTYTENTPTTYADPTGHFIIEALVGAAIGAGSFYIGCGLVTGGWTSSSCGEQALLGAGVGALAGLTDGASLLAGGACEEEDCIPPPGDTGGNGGTDPAAGCQCSDIGGDSSGVTSGTAAPKITVTSSSSDATVRIDSATSSESGVSIQIRDVSRAGFDEVRSEGAFGNQPLQLAQGNYAHDVLGSGPSKALGPGSFPDLWDTNGFTEIKPYHEGINPLEEYGSQLGQYRQAFEARFGYAPDVRLILYRYV